MAKNHRPRSLRSRQFVLEAVEPRALLSASGHLPVAGGGHAVRGSDFAIVARASVQRTASHARASVAHRASASASPTFVLSHLGGASAYATTGATGITPAEMRHAYGADAISLSGVSGTGAGQTIAIVDAYDDPTAASDLHNFDVAFGLADPASFTKLNETGGTTLPGTDPAGKGSSWALEESLDIEWAHVMAPAANIVLYEATSPSYSDLIANAANSARNNPSVSVISMSFGGGEFSGETGYDSYFATPSGHAGVTFVASTGDAGSPGGYPSFSPNVIAVGGTTLSVDSAGNYLGETAWSGGGGGTSTLEAEPSYQTPFQNTGKRTIPDVAMDADPNSGVPVYDSYDDGTSTPWAQVGGTSLAAPMFAGLIAVADQGRALNGLGTLDGRSQALPAIYAAAASNFHDVTSGGDGGFSAGPGYDEVTGRGSPVANLLVSSLAGSPVTTLAAPSNLTAKATSATQVALAWTDNASSATAQVLQRSSDGGATWVTLATLGGTAASFTDSAASAGSTYSYRVYSSAASTISANSNVASVTTVPAAPAGVSASAASSSQINVAWASATGATGYRIDRSVDGSTWTTIGTVGTGVTTYQDAGLAASTQYYYRVLATNAGGTSPASATATAKTAAASTSSASAAPSNLTSRLTSSTSATLAWSDNSNNETGFQVEYSLDGHTWYVAGTVAANTTAVQVSGLSAGTIYYFRVRSYNAAGTSAASNTTWI